LPKYQFSATRFFIWAGAEPTAGLFLERVRMLAYDNTIGCIEASEPDVLEMYRTAPLMMSVLTGSEPVSCEAYICAIRKKKSVQVYVALVAENQRILVYTTSGGPDSEEQYRHTLREALTFAESLGFQPEPMDLNYSSAMREVMVRNIKILRPPGSKIHALLRYGVANPPNLSRKSGAQKRHAASDSADSPLASPVVLAIPVVATGPAVPAVPVAVSAVPAAVSAAPALQPSPALRSAPALTQVAQSRAALPETAAVMAANAAGSFQSAGDADAAVLQGMVTSLAAENQDLRQRAAQEVASLRKKLALALSAQKKQADRLNALEAELLESRQSLELAEAGTGAIGALEEQLSAARAANDALTAQMQELSTCNQTAAAETTAAEEDRCRLAKENDALTVRLAALEATAVEVAELRQQVVQVAELSQQVVQVAELRQQVVQVAGQRDEAIRLKNEQAAKIATQAEALAQAREESARLTVERDAAQLRADQLAVGNGQAELQKEARQAELAALSAQLEAALLRARGAELEREARAAEMLALHREIDDLKQRDEAPPGADESVLGRSWSVEPGKAGGSGTETSASKPHWQSSSLADWYEPPTDELPIDYHDADGDFFPSAEEPEECPGRFLLQPGLAAIEYAAPAEVVELHQSINLVNLSPDGKAPASCQGYICGQKTAGGRLLVSVAVCGAQGGRTWVYLPEMQPDNEADYARAIAGAIGFAEGVGFMMEPVPLDPEGAQQGAAVRRCQVLRCTGQE
jgi:hypothetical protein